MKLTKFYKLKHAAANLDINSLARRISELEDRLTKDGQLWEPENTAITEEGIFYINPESGMATRVALYLGEHQTALPFPGKRSKSETTILEVGDSTQFNHYHLVRCNALSQLEREEEPKGYRIAQRLDGCFAYWIPQEPNRKGVAGPPIRVLPDIPLEICPNCFFKITSLLEGVKNLKSTTSPIRFFFNVDFFRSWVRYGESAKSGNSLANMYPKDWDEICRIRRAQTSNHCESCGSEVVGPQLKNRLLVHPTDHHKRKISFVRLQCLCQDCLNAQAQPDKGVSTQRGSTLGAPKL